MLSLAARLSHGAMELSLLSGLTLFVPRQELAAQSQPTLSLVANRLIDALNAPLTPIPIQCELINIIAHFDCGERGNALVIGLLKKPDTPKTVRRCAINALSSMGHG